MAESNRSTARGISRISRGSCRSASEGARKRRAASTLASPRATNTRAAGAPRPREDSRFVANDTTRSASAGNSQRLVLREVVAERAVVIINVFVFSHAEARQNLVFDIQELGKPIGLHLVNVKPRIIVKGELERAGDAFILAQ